MTRSLLCLALLASPFLAEGATPAKAPALSPPAAPAKVQPLSEATLQAADKGDSAAQLAAANAYHSGRGLKKDDAEARTWYRRAAEGGQVVAQRVLGSWYTDGAYGTPQDVAEGFRWLLRAAKQGDAMSQFFTGLGYREGRGVDPNPLQANFWLTVASAKASDTGLDAKTVNDYRKLSEKPLTPEQKDEVQRLVRGWNPTPETLRLAPTAPPATGLPNPAP